MKIFFDVDGVLMNNIHMERGWIDRWDKDIEKDLGLDPAKFQEIFKSWFPKAQLGHLDFEEEMQRWLKANDYDLKAWQIINYWNEKDTNLNEDLWPSIRALSQRPDVSLFVATNQTHARALYLWETSFKSHFKKIFYSAALGCFKTDAAFYQKIEEELRIDPHSETVLFFDDDKRNVKASSERGWQAVYFDTAQDCLNHPLIKPLLLP